MNKVNEIVSFANSVGAAWTTPAYDPAGNMTTFPKASDPTTAQVATYDAWNRLVKVSEGANTVAAYQYDGVNRRTIQQSYTSGTLTETRHCYYTTPSRWQVVEERVATATVAERQFVWGLRYIDDLVLRDRDTTSGGTLNERLYALQDANWNVTAITNSGGSVQERYAYSPYGVPVFLTSTFGSRSSSSFDWRCLFTGRRFDTETGLYDFRQRPLLPLIGLFLTRDPLIYPNGPNLYAAWFVPNRVDPFGTDVWIENTTAVQGLHRRICVDHYDGSCIKNGKYCISFGVDDQDNDGEPDGSAGGTSGGTISDFKNGVIYTDVTDKAVKEVKRMKMPCCQSQLVEQYMQSRVGTQGVHLLIGKNCRNFSARLYARIAFVEGVLGRLSKFCKKCKPLLQDQPNA